MRGVASKAYRAYVERRQQSRWAALSARFVGAPFGWSPVRPSPRCAHSTYPGTTSRPRLARNTPATTDTSLQVCSTTSVVSRKFLVFQRVHGVCGKARPRREWWTHCQGTQRGHRPRGARPSGVRHARHCRVAVLANMPDIPCGPRLASTRRANSETPETCGTGTKPRCRRSPRVGFSAAAVPWDGSATRNSSGSPTSAGGCR